MIGLTRMEVSLQIQQPTPEFASFIAFKHDQDKCVPARAERRIDDAKQCISTDAGTVNTYAETWVLVQTSTLPGVGQI
jgi:isopropylmalate/homocitrate/citramalate synthase